MAKALNSLVNRRMYQSREDGCSALRVFDRASHGMKMPRRLVKCGDCDAAVEIYYDETSLEINGVMGSIENWREILLPLLGIKA
jgi:hypothetical protein